MNAKSAICGLLGILVLLVFWLFCSKQPTESNEPYSIDITGKILDKDGNPMANAIAYLPEYGFSDTTGTDGSYRILATEAEIQNASAKRQETDKDSLQILKGGQIITIFELASLIDTFPDLFVLQRNIYGKIDPTVTSFKRVEAVLKYLGDPTTAAPKIAKLWYNQSTHGYSGFVYFVYTPDEVEYSIYVNAYNGDSLLTGRSETVQFSSIAGDIEIPSFDPLNAIPTANAGTDTTVSINDSVSLTGTASDAFDGQIVKMEWDIGNTGEFVVSQTGETTFTAPSTTNSHYICVFRITDNDGNIVTDARNIEVIADAPSVSILGNSTVPINTPVTFTAHTSQSFGEITKYRWGSNFAARYLDSSGISFTYKVLMETTAVIKLEVTDDDGNIETATKTVVITNDAPVITGLQDTTISVNDVVEFSINASDSNGLIPTYYWDFGDGSANQYDTTKSPSISHKFPATAMACTVKVAVADSFGAAIIESAIVDVILDVPAVTIMSDTTISINDSVTLKAIGTDIYGTIARYFWAIDGANYSDTTISGSIHTVFATDSIHVVRVKVEDDDKMISPPASCATTVLSAPTILTNPQSQAVSIGQVCTLSVNIAGYPSAFWYEWKKDGTTISNATGDILIIGSIAVLDSGDYTVMATNTQGSITSEAAHLVVNLASPQITMQPKTIAVNAGENCTLSVHATGNPMPSFQWKQDEVSIGGATDSNYILMPAVMLDSGNYAVVITNTQGDVASSIAHLAVVGVQSVSAGGNHSMMIRTDGTLWACGDGDLLGTGTVKVHYAPVQIMSGVQSVSSGGLHSMILSTDGTLWGCGGNSYGQLGDGTTTGRRAIVQIMPGVQSVSAGGHHSSILKTDGTLWACGYNYYGQLGDGTNTNRYAPVQIMTGVQSVSAGDQYSMILKTDGTLWACGQNYYGKLGDGTTVDRHTPVLIIPK